MQSDTADPVPCLELLVMTVRYLAGQELRHRTGLLGTI